nr:RNA-directed DNA polymerase, eukaryota, reverse transcriptase zinc-binding domain protein [Tanacetum cinerariifolium]
IIKGQIHWICVKELEAWMLKFNTKTEDDTYLKEESEGNNENDLGGKAVNSEDPFRIYKILKRNKDTSGSEGDTPQYPQGFTPVDEENVVGNNPGNASQPNPTKSGNNEKAQSNKDICNHGTKFQASGSILEVMDELIKDFIRHLIDSWDGECILLGYSFTWAHEFASKMSKLDRFLISEAEDNQKLNENKRNIQNNLIELDKILDQVRCNDDMIQERVLVDGDQIVNPSMVKNEFLKHFANRFNLIDHDVVAAVTSFFSTSTFPPGCKSSFIALIPKSQEAKMVKYFHPIRLVGSMYKIITKILANRLSLITSELVSDVQSSFVSNREIVDGSFILNELLSWCKHKNTKALIFKIDFEKAFNLMRCDYLDVVLNNFGFGLKWRSWIQGCLNYAMGSILVNGSLTLEFKFSKGLKYGDPLPPFLFILIMESLHLSFNNVVNVGLYNGIHIDDSLSLSHLFYADDVIFIASKKNGGLGVSSFFAFSCALLFKWILRFIANGSTLWSRFITAISSVRRAFDNPPFYSRRSPSLDIVSEVRKLFNKGIDLLSLVKKKSGELSPHSGIEKEQLLLLILNTSYVILPNIIDRWT